MVEDRNSGLAGVRQQTYVQCHTGRGKAGDPGLPPRGSGDAREDRGGGVRATTDGAFSCHAVTPSSIENVWDLYEIGDDYVLASVTDELGVEYVHVYERTP